MTRTVRVGTRRRREKEKEAKTREKKINKIINDFLHFARLCIH